MRDVSPRIPLGRTQQRSKNNAEDLDDHEDELKALRSRIWRLERGAWAVAGLLVVPALQSAGVPTEMIWKIVSTLL
jgi:hypothetical protein